MITPKEFLERELAAGISPDNPKFVALAERTAAEVAELAHLKTIDFGAGTGVYAKAFADAGFSIKALDIWKEHRDFMREQYPGLQILATPVKADFMLFIETAEHMTDDEIAEAIVRIDPDYILFSSTSETTENDEEWGHINIKTQDEWVEFWRNIGYVVERDLKYPTKWSKLLARV